MPSDADIARLAHLQHGNVATRQLIGLGFSKEAIRHRRRVGRLIQRYHGVHAFGYVRTDLLSRASASHLAAGSAAAVTGRSAACVFGVPLSDEGEAIHVIRPTRGDEREGLVLHEGDPGKPWHRHNLPLTSPERTLLAVAETESQETLVRVYNELQVLRLLSAERLSATLSEFIGRQGLAAIKRLLGGDLGKTRSVLEDIFVPLVRAARFRSPPSMPQSWTTAWTRCGRTSGSSSSWTAGASTTRTAPMRAIAGATPGSWPPAM